MSDEYSSVAKGKLKLKSDGCAEAKKKSKKRKRDKDKMKTSVEHTIREEMNQDQAAGGRRDGQQATVTRTLTKAELAFKQQQEKTVSGDDFNEWDDLLINCDSFVYTAKEEDPGEGLSDA